MQRYEVPADFLALNYSERVKYFHPVLILIKIGVLVRKKIPEDDYFLPFGKKCSPHPPS